MSRDSEGSVLSRAFTLAGAVLGALVAASSAQAAVGRTAGSFDVSSTGAATYTIPIFAPSGVGGLQPNIALAYNSNGGVGYLGRGWMISMLSSIQRCGRTLTEDGISATVQLVLSDGYCLDGNRLRLQSGTYGQAGSVYHTQIADFSRVTANGTAGSGPASWTVQRKDGLIYTYGSTSDSRVLATGTNTARQWMVSQISDRSGNTMRFTWKSADASTTGITHPVKIEWTQTSAGSGAYVYSMEFTYGANVPASSYTAYQAGTQIYEGQLLTGIALKVAGTVQRNYVLTYGDSPTTSAKRLTQVKECSDSSPNDCLSPTQISYQDGVNGTITGGPAVTVSIGSFSSYFLADFDADGRRDLAYKRGSTWYVRFGNATGYGNEFSTGLGNVKVGKLLGNGRDNLLALSGNTWYVYEWNGSFFFAQSTGITTAASSADITIADADGDGRDDLLYVTNTSIGTVMGIPLTVANIAIHRNIATNSVLSFAAAVVNPTPMATNYAALLPTQYGPLMLTGVSSSISSAGDVDGDNRKDLAATINYTWCTPPPSPPNPTWQPTCGTLTLNQILRAYGTLQYSQTLVTQSHPIGASVVKDVNGDSCDDYTVPSGPTNYLALSNCNGGIAAYLPNPFIGSTGWGDWNGDDKRDFFYQNSTTSTWWVKVLQIGGTSGPWQEQDTGIPNSACAVIFGTRALGDGQNENGQDDIGCIPSSFDAFKVYSHSNATRPDLAVQFADGFGVTVSPSYGALTNGLYTPYTDASYPYRDVTSGRTVVGSIATSDGIGGTYTTTYQYFGAVTNLHGPGFAGFDQIRATDSRNGIQHAQMFRRDWPYSGSLSGETDYQGNGIPIRSRAVTLTAQTLDGTLHNERYFIYPQTVTESAYEVGGAKNGQMIRQSVTQMTLHASGYGNPGTLTTTVTDKDAGSLFFNHSWVQTATYDFAPDYSDTNWCVGLPTSVTTTEQATNETNVVRSQALTNDYAKCRVTAHTTEPSGGIRRVDTALAYDAFGNVQTVTVTGRKPEAGAPTMSVRTTTTIWGSADGTMPGTGQFPVSVENTLNQTTWRTFHPTFGSLLTETDPNSIAVARNEYDTFGNLTRARRADDTATRYSHAACSFGNCRLIVTASERDAADVEFRSASTQSDMFGRKLVEQWPLLSGNSAMALWQYDSLGRLDRESGPVYAAFAVILNSPLAWIDYSYDLLNRVTSQTRPRSFPGMETLTTTFTYSGDTQVMQDAELKNSTKILDAMGRLRRSQDHDPYYQDFAYDAAGSLRQVTDSLGNTLFTAAYTYGAQAFQISSTDMDLGARTYQYNSLGEQVRWTDAKNNEFTQQYDQLGRVISRTDHYEGVTTNWTWGNSATAKNIGRLDSVSMPGYLETYAYDGVGRPATQTITADQNYAIDFAYNNQGALDTLTYPVSTAPTRLKVKYGYENGTLKSVRDWTNDSAGTFYWTASSEDPHGQIAQETLGNGIVTTRMFDPLTGQLASIQSGIGGGAGLQNQSYLYDKVGNVTQRQESALGVMSENFYYDDLHRLDHSTLQTSSGTTTNLQMHYDAMGNITKRSDVNGGAATWSYDATRKHAVTGVGVGSSYVYDANGNMTSRGGPDPATIGWTSYNYPASVATATESATFLYGPDRQYYKQEYSGPSGSEITHYIGGLLEKVSKSGNDDWRHYIQAGGQTVAIVSRTSGGTTISYPLEDHQGSSSVLTDSSGTGLVRESFDAFGHPRDGSDWDGAVPSGDLTVIEGVSRRGYTSHSMLGRMGLIHMNGRMYDARIGRFLSPDPYVPYPDLTQSFNRYAYVRNNPLTYVDPSGFMEPRPPIPLDGVEVVGNICRNDAVPLVHRSYCERLVKEMDGMSIPQLLCLFKSTIYCPSEPDFVLPQREYSRLENAQCQMHWGRNCAAVNAMTDEEALSARMGQEFAVPIQGIGSVFAGGARGVMNLAGLPDDASQLGHIFRNAAGHLADTPANRQLLVNLSNNAAARLGTDRFGNVWSALERADGSQIWVSTRNGVIQNGGLNPVARPFPNVVGP